MHSAQVLGILDEVLGDVCADNLEEEEYERLLGTAGSRIPGYVDALHNNRYLPGNLFDNLADVKQVANATALFQHSPQYGEIKCASALCPTVALVVCVCLTPTDTLTHEAPSPFMQAVNDAGAAAGCAAVQRAAMGHRGRAADPRYRRNAPAPHQPSPLTKFRP